MGTSTPSPDGSIDEPTRPLDYVFIVTYGRSGSTLVQGILNSIPGYLIRGENYQVARNLYQFDLDARRARRKVQRMLHRVEQDHSDATSPFFGMEGYDHAAARRMFRRLMVTSVLRPEPDTRVTGFKEIRWAGEDNLHFVDWLRRLFPRSRFIINTRNLQDVSRSGWWAQDERAAESLQVMHDGLIALGEALGDAAYRTHYDDFVADPTSLAGLFAWLGEEFEVDRVKAILDRTHSTRTEDLGTGRRDSDSDSDDR